MGDKAANRKVIDRIFVQLFNDVLSMEERYLKVRGLVDLSISEIHLLEAIAQKENPAMGDVAAQVSLTNGTVTTAVKRLEEKCYVWRQKDDRDRRISRVRLSEAGQRALAVHDSFHETLLNEICKNSTALEDEALMQSLKSLLVFFQGLKEKI